MSLVAAGAAVCSGLMALLWLRQVRTQDATEVDAGWVFCLAGLAVLYAWGAPGDAQRRLLVAAMAGLWGLRLGAYLLLRHRRSGREDGRYRRLREASGRWTQPVFFLLYQAQVFLAVAFSLPILVVANSPWRLGWIDAVGAAIWIVSVGGESLADLQLSRFRSDPAHAGKTCRKGLWRYSRHPNYFFEWLHWWAYVPLAVDAHRFWVTLLGPILMRTFLYRVTGIPFTEAQALRTRPDYAAYQRTTSPFFPLPPNLN